jgi:lipid-binding SYLF domain-containing protein
LTNGVTTAGTSRPDAQSLIEALSQIPTWLGKESTMKTLVAMFLVAAAVAGAPARADEYTDAVARFRQAPTTQPFFDQAYGYAIFPSVGKGGAAVGGAYGKGRVYKGGVHTGDASLAQLTVGFQLGGQVFSELIFFENKAAYDAFTSGGFEFGAQASAVAIAVGANAQAGSTGASANVADQQSKAAYVNGTAVFTMAKGGLMYEAALGGQKFTFHPKK